MHPTKFNTAFVFLAANFLASAATCSQLGHAALGKQDLQSLESKVRKAYEKAVVSVVKFEGEKGGFSGIIIDHAGEIATCGHHGLPPNTKITAVLSDGRKVKAVVLGRHAALDVGLIRLDEKGDWPAAPLGRSTDLQVGEPCLALGYPALYASKPALLRLGRVLAPGQGEMIVDSCYTIPGDSGGGLFDGEGRLIGICVQVGLRSRHVGVEVLLHLRDRLRAGKEIKDASAGFTPQEEWKKKDIRKVHDRVAPAVVRLLPAKDGSSKGMFTGVFVGSAGEILSCYRLNLPPGSKVTVRMADGRTAKAVLLGQSRPHEIALFRVEEKGNWPTVPLGSSAGLHVGDPCLTVGYAEDAKPNESAQARPGHVLSPGAGSTLLSSCPFLMTHSGWPLFDREGRLIGVCVSMDVEKAVGGPHYTRYAGAEVFARLRERLLAGGEIKESPGTFQLDPSWKEPIAAVRRAMVEISDDDKPIAWGLIVSGDGWVITKRSEISGYRRIRCRLSDGRRFDARIRAGSREHDLALLKMEADELPAVPWSKEKTVRTADLIAAIAPGSETARIAVVGVMPARNPPSPCYLPIILQPGQSAPIFSEWDKHRLKLELSWPNLRHLPAALKAGDRITHLDDVPTPSFQEYSRVLLKMVKAADAVAGERVKVSIQRGSETRQVFAPFLSQELPAWGLIQPLSLRRNGFPSVFAHDGGISPQHCLSPVVDRTGRVIGVTIARLAPESSYAIPASVVQRVLADLRVPPQ